MKHRVCDVGHLRASRARVADHRVEHLSSDNNWLVSVYTLANQLSLQHRDSLRRHFNSEVATSNHDSVRHLENLVYIVDTLLVFDFRYDFYRAVVSVENFLDVEHVLS